MRVSSMILVWAVLAGGCGEARPPDRANVTPSAPALATIPERPPQRGLLQDVVEFEVRDLDAIAARGNLRVLVAPSDTHFTIVRPDGVQGRAVDVALALGEAISRRAGKPINVSFVVSREKDLVSDLVAGKADVAANVLQTFTRDEQVAFATPILTDVREFVVTSAEKPLVSLEDVGGRTIHVRRDSDHHASALRLNSQLKAINRPPATIVVDRQAESDVALLKAVNDGRIPATIVDNYVYDRWQPSLPRTAVNRDVAVSQDGVIAWVTRKDAPKLLAALNEFFSTHKLTF